MNLINLNKNIIFKNKKTIQNLNNILNKEKERNYIIFQGKKVYL